MANLASIVEQMIREVTPAPLSQQRFVLAALAEQAVKLPRADVSLDDLEDALREGIRTRCRMRGQEIPADLNSQLGALSDTLDNLRKKLRKWGRQQGIRASILSGGEAGWRLVLSPVADTLAPGGAPTPNNLPIYLTEFVGRERELEEVGGLLDRSSLVTLTGTGGVGKTRLAVEAARARMGHHPDGLRFVDLAPLTSGEEVARAVGKSFGLREEPSVPLIDALSAHVRERRLFLLLDNCEHLVDAAAWLAEALLKAGPDLQVLATSRESLNVPGEKLYRVPSLSAPESGAGLDTSSADRFDAVLLFRDRAQALLPTFALTPQNVSAVGEICRRLDGIPLAIELAAGRIPTLSPGQIAGRLGERLMLLSRGGRTTVARHQTLRQALDWSYDLLGEREQILFGRLAVFRGSFDLESAESICADRPEDSSERPLHQDRLLDALAGLVDKSLVSVLEVDGCARYRLLETLREYAWAKLAGTEETSASRDRHLQHYLALAEEASRKLGGPQQVEWLQRLELDHDNLRAALDWASELPALAETGLLLAAALRKFWVVRGYLREGRERLEAALVHPAAYGRTNGRAKALGAAGTLAAHLGDFASASTLGEEALAIFEALGDKPSIAASLVSLGDASASLGEYESAHRLFKQALVIDRELGDRKSEADVLDSLGMLARKQGDYASARSICMEALAIARHVGDRCGTARTLNNLGITAHEQGDRTAAQAFYEQALVINRELGNRDWEAANLANMSVIARDERDYATAWANLEQALTIARETGNRAREANYINCQASVLYAQGAYSPAQRLWEHALAMNRDIGSPWLEADCLDRLALVACKQGEYVQAHALWMEALTINQKLGSRALIADNLEGTASLAAAQGYVSRAARLWGASEALRESIGTTSTLPEPDVAAARAVIGEGAFASAWTEGRAMTWEAAVKYALTDARA